MSNAPAVRPPLYYRLTTAILAPIYRQMVIKKSKDKPTLERELNERFAKRYQPPPSGALGVIWCHAVSLGELNTAYPLLSRLLDQGYGLWVTSTTQTGFERAARLFDGQIRSGRVAHSFVPVDRPQVIDAFLDHVMPIAVMFIETELWANTLYACRKRGIKTMMVNARLTQKSYQGYAKIAKVSQTMMANLDGIIAQDAESVQRFKQLGKTDIVQSDSLKWASVSALSEAQLTAAQALTAQIREAHKKQVWVMASTHDGEESIALSAHKKFLQKSPDALLILVPRHPERFEAVHQMCLQGGFVTARRSMDEPMTPKTQIYLADTMGELLAWYQVAQIAVVGGSFVPIGGHNPIEPASLATPVIMGAHDDNCKDLVKALKKVGALAQLPDEPNVADQLFEGLMQGYLYHWTAEQGALLVKQKQRVLEDQLNFVLSIIHA